MTVDLDFDDERRMSPRQITKRLQSARRAEEEAALASAKRMPERVGEFDPLPTTTGRYDVERIGERAEIPAPLRYAVYRRDASHCLLCGADRSNAEKNLDHVIPWSAGGADVGTNLRTTCPSCNEWRSNYYHDVDGRTLLPVTWWCTRCWTEDNHPWVHWAPKIDPAHPAWRDVVPFVDPDLEDLTFAYCAICDANGYTDKAL